MSQSPFDMLKARMAGAVVEAVTDVATSAVNEGTELVKNGIKSKIHSVVKNAKPDYEEEVDEEVDDDEVDDEVDDDEAEAGEEDSPLPIAFDAFDADKNLECAAACWKLWGIRAEDCDNLTEPDIVAQFKNGLAFVGNMSDLQEYCLDNDLDKEDVTVYGLTEDEDFDSSEIDGIKVGKNIIQYVTAFISSIDTSVAEQSFKGFHWDKDATVTKVVRTIPFMENIPLTMCGVAQAIIYTAKKDGQVQTYIHEFGEDSGEKPLVYALPTPEGEKWPRSILIHGGNMRVEDRGFVD